MWHRLRLRVHARRSVLSSDDSLAPPYRECVLPASSPNRKTLGASRTYQQDADTTALLLVDQELGDCPSLVRRQLREGRHRRIRPYALGRLNELNIPAWIETVTLGDSE